jgi:hypothetical protein
MLLYTHQDQPEERLLLVAKTEENIRTATIVMKDAGYARKDITIKTIISLT